MKEDQKARLKYYHDSIVGQLSILEHVADTDIDGEVVSVLQTEIRRLRDEFPGLLAGVDLSEYRVHSGEPTERYQVAEIVSYLNSIQATLRTRLDS